VNIATMTPKQLAEAGIPATVALRARVEEARRRKRRSAECDDLIGVHVWATAVDTYADALAVLEAKGQ
jgi:hypothetical protein